MPTSNGRSELPGVGEERLEAGLERRYNDIKSQSVGPRRKDRQETQKFGHQEKR